MTSQVSPSNLNQLTATYIAESKFDKAIDTFLEARAWKKAADLLAEQALNFYKMGQVIRVHKWLETIGNK